MRHDIFATLFLLCLSLAGCTVTPNSSASNNNEDVVRFAYFSPRPGASGPEGDVIVQAGDEVIATWPVRNVREFYELDFDEETDSLALRESLPDGTEQLRIKYLVSDAREATEAEQRVIQTWKDEYRVKTSINETPFAAATPDGSVTYLLYHTGHPTTHRFELWRYSKAADKIERVFSLEDFCKRTNTNIPVAADMHVKGLEMSCDGRMLAIGIPQEKPLFRGSMRHITDTWVWEIEKDTFTRVGPGVPEGWTEAGHLLIEEPRIPTGELLQSYIHLYDVRLNEPLVSMKDVAQAMVDGKRILIVRGWSDGGPTMDREVEVWSSDLKTLRAKHRLARKITSSITFSG